MAKREFTAAYMKDGKWIMAWIEEVPGAHTQGRTMKEARENLREALAMVLEENRRRSARSGASVQRENFEFFRRNVTHEALKTH